MSTLADRALTPAAIKKLKDVLEEGSKTLSDIETLQESLKDTVASIAEELDIPKRAINAAIKAKHKDTLIDMQEKANEVQEILEITGNT